MFISSLYHMFTSPKCSNCVREGETFPAVIPRASRRFLKQRTFQRTLWRNPQWLLLTGPRSRFQFTCAFWESVTFSAQESTWPFLFEKQSDLFCSRMKINVILIADSLRCSIFWQELSAWLNRLLIKVGCCYWSSEGYRQVNQNRSNSDYCYHDDGSDKKSALIAFT